MTSTAIAVQEKVDGVIEMIRDEHVRAELRGVLPEGIAIEKFERVLKTALLDDVARQREAGKMLVNADRASLIQAVIKCAADGLLPDGREAALVKRGDGVAYQPMVQGFRKIAAEGGWTITAHVVCANDEFEYAVGSPPRHIPARPGTPRGEFVACYAVARHRDGRHPIERVLYPDEVAKRRKLATTQNVWNQWEEQQWEKTAARDVFAEIPFDPADRDRAVRVLQAGDVDGEQAAEIIYGVARPAFGELPAGRGESSESSVPAAAAGDGGGGASAAASSVSEPDGDSPAAGFAPDDFGAEVSPEAASEGPSEEELAAAQQAAGYVVQLTATDNWANGLTLAQIRADDRHEVFFRWAMSRATGPLNQQAVAYARVQLPDLYDELTAKAAA